MQGRAQVRPTMGSDEARHISNQTTSPEHNVSSSTHNSSTKDEALFLVLDNEIKVERVLLKRPPAVSLVASICHLITGVAMLLLNIFKDLYQQTTLDMDYCQTFHAFITLSCTFYIVCALHNLVLLHARQSKQDQRRRLFYLICSGLCVCASTFIIVIVFKEFVDSKSGNFASISISLVIFAAADMVLAIPSVRDLYNGRQNAQTNYRRWTAEDKPEDLSGLSHPVLMFNIIHIVLGIGLCYLAMMGTATHNSIFINQTGLCVLIFCCFNYIATGSIGIYYQVTCDLEENCLWYWNLIFYTTACTLISIIVFDMNLTTAYYYYHQDVRPEIYFDYAALGVGISQMMVATVGFWLLGNPMLTSRDKRMKHNQLQTFCAKGYC